MKRLDFLKQKSSGILYLKNIPVYDIENQRLLNKECAPGLLQKNASNESFKQWLKYRYSANTNSFARVLKGVTFGQGNRVLIDKSTSILSLSDCYWIPNEEMEFEYCSPYFVDFWKGNTEYKGGSIPTLYANGFLSKCWISSTELFKKGDTVKIEIECSRLVRLCNISCAEVLDDEDGIIVKNFTSSHVMLESADMSGKIDPDDFDENTIIELFGLDGFRMIIIDAIFGNGDRHAGNFGFLRSADTGEYLSMAPLYDFDHALDATGEKDRLLLDAIDIANANEEYQKEAIHISNSIVKETINDVFRKRAICVLKQCR